MLEVVEEKANENTVRIEELETRKIAITTDINDLKINVSKIKEITDLMSINNFHNGKFVRIDVGCIVGEDTEIWGTLIAYGTILVGERIADVRGHEYIKDIDLVDYVTKEYLDNYVIDSFVPALEKYALKTDLPDLEPYLLKDDFPLYRFFRQVPFDQGVMYGLNHNIRFEKIVHFDTTLVSFGEVIMFEKIKNGRNLRYYVDEADLEPYALKTELPNLTPYALKTELNVYALKTELPNLTPYALKTELNNYALKTSLNVYALKTELPNLTPYALKTELTTYAKKTDLNIYALKTELPNLNNYLTKDEFPSFHIFSYDGYNYSINEPIRIGDIFCSGTIDLHNTVTVVGNILLNGELYNEKRGGKYLTEPDCNRNYASRSEFDYLRDEHGDLSLKVQTIEEDLNSYVKETELNKYALKTDIPEPFDTNNSSFSGTTSMNKLEIYQIAVEVSLYNMLKKSFYLTEVDCNRNYASKFLFNDLVDEHAELVLKVNQLEARLQALEAKLA